MSRYDFADTIGIILVIAGVLCTIIMADWDMLSLSFIGIAILVTTSLLDDEINS